MASTKYHGKDGQITYSSSLVSGIKSWTLDVACDVIECTDFRDLTGKTWKGGQWSWSGGFEGYKAGVALEVVGTQVSIILNETQTGTQIWSGSVVLTGLAASGGVDSMVTYAYTFQGTGELTEPTT